MIDFISVPIIQACIGLMIGGIFGILAILVNDKVRDEEDGKCK